MRSKRSAPSIPSPKNRSHKVEEFFLSPASELALFQKEKDLCYAPRLLGEDTIVIFDDLLAIEDRWVALKTLPGVQSPLFSTFEDFLRQTETFPPILDRPADGRALRCPDREKSRPRVLQRQSPLQPLAFPDPRHTTFTANAGCIPSSPSPISSPSRKTRLPPPKKKSSTP